jgi:hypothetical protein
VVSLGPPVSSTTKTDRHDITEILLKVVLSTMKQTNNIIYTHSTDETGTTISGFADSQKKKLMPNDPRFFLTCDHKHKFFFGLTVT